MIVDRTRFAPSTHADLPAIWSLHERAFGRSGEAHLAQQLIEGEQSTLDLCAVIDGNLIGHCLLTELQGPEGALALAPLSVDPNWRDFQIGTELVRQLLHNARSAGWSCVFVLGDPDYYGRFGFTSALADHIVTPFQGPAFQAVELKPGALTAYEGGLSYPSAFDLVDAA